MAEGFVVSVSLKIRTHSSGRKIDGAIGTIKGPNKLRYVAELLGNADALIWAKK